MDFHRGLKFDDSDHAFANMQFMLIAAGINPNGAIEGNFFNFIEKGVAGYDYGEDIKMNVWRLNALSPEEATRE